MMNPKVSIIILNWNGLKYTIECLESLKKITYPNYEVIVVDNGSEGNDADVLEKRYKGYIKLIRNKENLGFTGGNNIATRQVLKEGKSNYILFLNNDTKVDRDWLKELVRAADNSGPRVGRFQSKLLSYIDHRIIDSTGHKKVAGRVINRGKGQEDRGQFDKKKEIFSVRAASALYKKEMLQEIGLFDGNFFAGFEDVDLDFRANRAGWKAIFVPESIAYHKRGSTMTRDLKKFQEIGHQNQYIVVARWYSLVDKIFVSFWWIFEILVNAFKVFFKLDTPENVSARKKIIKMRMKHLFKIWKKAIKK